MSVLGKDGSFKQVVTVLVQHKWSGQESCSCLHQDFKSTHQQCQTSGPQI